MAGKTDFQAAACSGKKTYDCQHARRVAKNVSRRHDQPMQPYHCTWCHGWHIGQPGRAGRGQQSKRKQKAVW